MKDVRQKQIETLYEAYNMYKLVSFPSPENQRILDQMLEDIKYLVKEQMKNGS